MNLALTIASIASLLIWIPMLTHAVMAMRNPDLVSRRQVQLGQHPWSRTGVRVRNALYLIAIPSTLLLAYAIFR